MKPAWHAVSSLSLSVILFNFTNSLSFSVTVFLSGIFIDLDHLLDYFRINGLNLNLRTFLSTKDMHIQTKRLYLIFHGFDFAALLSILVFTLISKEIGMAMFLGMFLHLIMDQIFNPTISKWAYFLVYRWKTGFLSEKSFSQKS